MKKTYSTYIQPKWIISFYTIKKYFFYTEKKVTWNSIKYEDRYFLNASCYKKNWSISYKSEADLKRFLKSNFTDNNVMFYSSLELALKHNNQRNNILIVKKIGDVEQQAFNFNLKKRKKKNLTNGKKRKKLYYCDCYLCVGGDFDKIFNKDDKKINTLSD